MWRSLITLLFETKSRCQCIALIEKSIEITNEILCFLDFLGDLRYI